MESIDGPLLKYSISKMKYSLIGMWCIQKSCDTGHMPIINQIQTFDSMYGIRTENNQNIIHSVSGEQAYTRWNTLVVFTCRD